MSKRRSPDPTACEHDRLLNTLERLLAIEATDFPDRAQPGSQSRSGGPGRGKGRCFHPRPDRLYVGGSRGEQYAARTAPGSARSEPACRSPMAVASSRFSVPGNSYRTGRADQDAEELIGITQALGVPFDDRHRAARRQRESWRAPGLFDAAQRLRRTRPGLPRSRGALGRCRRPPSGAGRADHGRGGGTQPPGRGRGNSLPCSLTTCATI